MNYEKELSFAKDMAHQAGLIIREEFYKAQSIEMKSDDSPVTAIDKRVNELVSANVQGLFPGDAFDGEEGTGGNMQSRRVWVCDPIDGTISFLLSVPGCMFMLGLFVEGVEQIAVAYNPITEELYEATRGMGAFKNSKPIHVSAMTGADHAFIIVDAKVYRESDKEITALESLGYQVAGVNGTGTKVMKVAEGLAAGIFRDKGDYHDVGVGSLVAEEAGAKVGSLRGAALFDDNLRIYDGFIIANPEAYRDIQSITQSQ